MKIGDRVVYIGGCLDSEMILPEINKEIVTIVGLCPCHASCGHYRLGGYEAASDGMGQNFHPHNLRKVEEKGFTNALTKELANKPLVKEGIEIITPEKV